MDERIHLTIQAFLEEMPIVSLVKAEAAGEEQCLKAGVVPFVRQPEFRYCVMKPVAQRPELGAPAFQLCKGTRMHRLPDRGWCDMRGSDTGALDRETLAVTALREGIEELGIKLERIKRLLDMGPYGFSSASTGKDKQMWLFAVEMASQDVMLPMTEVEATTAERQWLTLEQFAVCGRPDHYTIFQDIATALEAYY